MPEQTERRGFVVHELAMAQAACVPEPMRDFPVVSARWPQSAWTCLDPTAIQGTAEETLAAFRRARDQIRQQLDRWLPEMLSKISR